MGRAILLIALVAGASVIVTACGGSSGSTPQQSRFSISGTVVGLPGSPANIRVSVLGQPSYSATTDPNGAYRIDNLPAGEYEVYAVAPGYVVKPIQQRAQLRDQDVALPSFRLEAPDDGLSPAISASANQQPERSHTEDQVALANGQSLSAYVAGRGIPRPSRSSFGPERTRPLAGPLPLSTLPPATSPEQRRMDVVAAMLLAARFYSCGRLESNRCTLWDAPADPSDPVFMPAQLGLTYVYGGKNPLVRTLPTDNCVESITFGMDCSGLIYNVARLAGIGVPEGNAAKQMLPSSWTPPLEWELQFRKVLDGSVQSGDIVGWSDHNGIAETGFGAAGTNFISSTGAPDECAANIVPRRGPRSMSLSWWLNEKGTPTVLRLVVAAPLTGTWTGTWNWTTCPSWFTCDKNAKYTNLALVLSQAASSVTGTAFSDVSNTLTGTAEGATFRYRVDYSGRTDVYDTCVASVTAGDRLQANCDANYVNGPGKYSVQATRRTD